jgi:hypothetical protein
MEKYLIPAKDYNWVYRMRAYSIKKEKPETLWENGIENKQ